MLTVKSFNLQAIRKRYLDSTKRTKGGSVERREPALGGLVYVEIENGKIVNQKILARYKEARGLDYSDGKLILSSENQIYFLDLNEQYVRQFTNPWFSYIHTIKFNEKKDRILVASSGVDTILEVDVNSGDTVWEWNAWEEGLNQGENPQTGEKHLLTRHPDEFEKLKSAKKNVILIENPEKEKLPTALRAAFINSAEYADEDNVLLTFFHDGDVKHLNKKSRNLEVVLKGFSKPHGGQFKNGNYYVTDTAGGKVVVNDKSYIFNNLPGKGDLLSDKEWLQTSHQLDNSIVTIDSNRTSLVIFDPDQKKLSTVPYDPDWAVQDFIDFDMTSAEVSEQLTSLLHEK